MPQAPDGDITELLKRWGDGDAKALAEAAAASYSELRDVAGGLLWRRGGSETLQATVARRYPPQSMNPWVALSSAVFVMEQARQFQAALPLLKEMAAIMDANRVPENDARRAQTWVALGTALHGLKKDDDASAAPQKGIALCDSAGPVWAPAAAAARKRLAEIGPHAASR